MGRIIRCNFILLLSYELLQLSKRTVSISKYPRIKYGVLVPKYVGHSKRFMIDIFFEKTLKLNLCLQRNIFGFQYDTRAISKILKFTLKSM